MSIRRILCSTVLLVSLTAVGGYAQDHRDDHQDHAYVRHDEWKKGAKIKKEDWDRGSTVDYKAHHLKAPPRGYEWREVDGNYVLAAAATGVIASALVASSVR